jgi:putative transposase
VEVVYERTETAPSGNPALCVAVDIGVDNLAALTSNKRGFVSHLVNGRPIKSINQFYNKRRAELQKALGHPGTTQRMERLTTKRTRRINQYLHEASKAMIALLVEEGIGTLVVGKNPGWKQEAELGRVNNQHFVQIPQARFIQMLEYKALLAGIRFILHEESYTSKASFLDNDTIPTYDPTRKEPPVFSGKRVKRGLYRAKDGRMLNADVNGSANILRKALPNALWANGIEGVVVRPLWLTFARSVLPDAQAAA